MERFADVGADLETRNKDFNKKRKRDENRLFSGQIDDFKKIQ